jgi:hypothetical protein
MAAAVAAVVAAVAVAVQALVVGIASKQQVAVLAAQTLYLRISVRVYVLNVQQTRDQCTRASAYHHCHCSSTVRYAVHMSTHKSNAIKHAGTVELQLALTT